jgi:GNAT superfamily N-acetyltransferase
MNSFNFKSSLRYPGEFSEWLNHQDDCDQQILQIQVSNSEGNLVGRAFFGYLSKDRGGFLACLEIFIVEEYRRQKIATRIYDLAEAHYQDEVKPYPGGSKDAGLFWDKRLKK